MFHASKLQDYVEKDCSFRIYQNLKITYDDPDHIFLVITQNWAMRLCVGFVMPGHIYHMSPKKLQSDFPHK